MEKLLDQALDVFDRKVQLLERGGWFTDLQRKRRALDRLIPTIRATTDAITRDLYLARTAQAAGIERDVLVRELEMLPRRGRGRPAPPAPAPSLRPGGVPPRPFEEPTQTFEHAPDSTAERELLRVMILHPDLIEQVVEEVSRVDVDEHIDTESDLEAVAGPSPVLRDPVYGAIFNELAAGGDLSPEGLAERLGPFENLVVEQLRSEPGAIVSPQHSVAGAIKMLKARALLDRLDEHTRMIPLAPEADKPELLKREVKLQKELAAVMDNRKWRGFSPRGM